MAWTITTDAIGDGNGRTILARGTRARVSIAASTTNIMPIAAIVAMAVMIMLRAATIAAAVTMPSKAGSTNAAAA